MCSRYSRHSGRGMRRSSRTYQLLRRLRNLAAQRTKRIARPNGTAFVSFKARVSADVQLGNYAFIAPLCNIPPAVSIGEYSLLAAEVAIVGDDHDWHAVGIPVQFSGRPPQRATTIGTDVWIGRRTVLMRGLTVGDGAIIAAGSVVTKNVPSGEVWAGVPASKLRERFESRAILESHLSQVARGDLQIRFAEPLGGPE